MTDIQPNRFGSLDEFVSGTVLLIDKPYQWTSFDVVNRIKGFVRNHVKIPPNEHGHDQRFKIGHAGTLDPLATGLLVICTGKLTKQIDQFQGGEKEYTGSIVFGSTTPSYDLETAPEGSYPTDHLNADVISEMAASMIGEQWQTPPAFSAKQIGGKRAYVSARKGQNVIIPAVQIKINEFEINGYDSGQSEFRIRCSKGTYIRTIAHDIGQKLGSGSHLISLRRTKSYPFNIENAMTMDELMARLSGFSTDL